MTANLAPAADRARRAVEQATARPRPDRDQDLAPGRRLGDARCAPGRASASTTVFDSVWMNDHLTDVSFERHGASLEALTTMAALVHRVPGKWLGHAVLSSTFRHPAVLAKAATVLDHATGGRFIVGLGAGWHEGEHVPFGIPMPPMPERFDRFESAVHVLPGALVRRPRRPPGVTRPDPFYPLAEATNEPPPLTPGGPPLWLGGQKRRGIALAAAVADGWALPAVVALGSPSDLRLLQRASVTRILRRAGRDRARPGDASNRRPGADRDDGRGPGGGHSARRSKRSGVARPRSSSACRRAWAPAGVDAVAREVAQPVPRRDRTDAPAGESRSGRRRPKRTSSGSSPSSTPQPRTTRRRSTRSAGPTRRIPARPATWPRSTAAVVGGRDRRSDLRLSARVPRPAGASIAVAARGPPTGDRRALLCAISGAARAAGKTELHMRLRRGPPRGHRVPRPSRLHGAGARQERRLELAGLAAPTGRATARDRAHDARGAARSRRWRPRRRARDLRRHPGRRRADGRRRPRRVPCPRRRPPLDPDRTPSSWPSTRPVTASSDTPAFMWSRLGDVGLARHDRRAARVSRVGASRRSSRRRRSRGRSTTA